MRGQCPNFKLGYCPDVNGFSDEPDEREIS